jgi:hypothetical protein
MKKPILIIFLLIFLSSFTYGAINDDIYNGAVFYYELEESSLNYIDEVWNDDLTVGTIPLRITGKLNYGQEFDRLNSEYLSTGSDTTFRVDYPVISTWVNTDSLYGTQYIAGGKDNKGWSLYISSTGTVGFQVKDSTNNNDRWITTTTLLTGTWYHVFAYYDGSDTHICINGASDGSQTLNAHDNNINYESGSRFVIGNNWDSGALFAGRYLDADIDEFYYGDFGNTANCSHANYLYNSGTPGVNQQYPFNSSSASASFTINYLSPVNNTVNNTNLYVEYSVTDTTNTQIDCSLYINDTLNTTSSNIAVNTTINFNISLTTDGNYNYFINCTNSTITDQTANYNYIYDTTQPFINIYYPLADNSTQFNYTNRSLILDINIQDDHLYKANLTIYNASGSVMYNNYTGDISGQDSYNYTSIVDMSLWEIGEYLLNISASDSHTAKAIKNFNPEKEKFNKIKYKTPKEWGDTEFSFEYIGKTDLIEYKDIKKFDRHSIKATFDGENKNKFRWEEFQILSNKPLIYLENSDYPCHIVSKNEFKGLWFDCVYNGMENDIQEVVKITEFEYLIKVYTDNDEIEFNSLGGLNFNSKTLTFNIMNNLTIQANDTNTGLLVSNFSVLYNSITYEANGTSLIIPVYANASANIQISKIGYTDSSYIVPILYAPVSFIGNLSSSGVTLSVYDEITESLITGQTINIDVIGNTSNEYTTTTGSKTISGLTSGDYEIRLNTNNYHPSSYFATLNASAVQTINLYMLNDSSAVSIRVIHSLLDQDSEILSNYTIKLQRYYSSSGTYKTIRMSKTNFEGQSVLYVEPYDVYYKLEYDDENNNLMKITDPSPFFLTETNDIINTETPVYTSWRSYDNVIYNLSFVNQSGTIYARYIFSDTNNIVRAGCLRVDRIYNSDLINICYNCTNAAGGTLTCVINTTQTGQWKATGLIDTNTSGSWYSVLTEYYIKNNELSLGSGGVFYSLVLIGTVAFMGIASVSGSIVLLLIGLIGVAALSLMEGLSIGILTYLIVLGFIIIFIVRKSKE